MAPFSPHKDPPLSLQKGRPLISRQEQELELNNLDLGILGEYSHIHPSWENVALSKIKNMMVTEQGLSLDTICHFLEEHSQKLLEFLSLDPKKAADKALLFHLYGLILCECPSVEQVQCHLASLLELSLQHTSYREGIALAVGLASTEHLQEVWTLLAHLGRTKFLLSAIVSPDSQPSDSNLRRKWVSSTSLLRYGQIGKHIKEQILPWMDNIALRIVYFFSCGPCDEILKSSFLSAAILLTRSLREEYGSQRYKFTQIPELIQCLLDILKEEPNFLTTFF